MSKNKGITLIALIITIIILLILVGVSINLAIKGDLFGSAEKAVSGTNDKVAQEQTRVDELMGELERVESQNAVHNWQYTDSTRARIRCTCTRCKAFNDGDSTGRTVSIGQQIGETESKTASTSITGEKSGVSQGITDGNLTASDYGTNGSQTLSLNGEETKWVVFGYEDKDNDGLNEVLLLTTEHPTTNTIRFYGAAGYNNAVGEVNRMCKELYGENARGVTIEDVNRALGYTPSGGMYYLNSKWNTTGNLTTKLKDLGDMWTAITDYNTNSKAGVFYDPSHPEGISDNGATLGEYVLDGYWYIADSRITSTAGVPVVSSNIADNTKAMIFGSTCDYYYWLASRGAVAYSNCARFGPGYVYYGFAFSYVGLFYSDGITGYGDFGLRPLVSLTSDIPTARDVLFTTFTANDGGGEKK